MGLTTIGMTGGDGGQMRGLCDIQLNVPSKKTARIQESHICMAHTICELAENAFAE
jgi:D-sedoheptulose 7-phosphate isomerase